MFHSQLIGGLSVGFKPVSGSPYTVTIHDVGKTLRATANTIFNVGQLGATDGSVISFENPTSYVITVQGIDGVTIQNEPVPVLANSTVSIVKISNTAWRLHSSGSGSGGGSGGAVRQWDLTPTTVPAQATVMPIPAPYLNIIYNPAGVVGTITATSPLKEPTHMEYFLKESGTWEHLLRAT